jgi:hypothetical protein
MHITYNAGRGLTQPRRTGSLSHCRLVARANPGTAS